VAETKIQNIRNISLIGHSDSGKTTLTEAILFFAKATNRFGSVDEGTTVSDYNHDEIERKISINSSVMTCSWNHCKLNIIDTPGYMDFTGEVLSALHAIEMAVLVVHGVSGIEVGTEIVWDYCANKEIPRVVIINKLDKEHANFQEIVDQLKNRFTNNIIPFQFPVNQGPTFDSIVDLISMKVFKYSNDRSGKFTKEDIPDDIKAQAEDMRNVIKEGVAESDDDLLEKYLEEGDISDEELSTGLKNAIASNTIIPVFCANAAQGVGVNLLMDFIVENGITPTEGKQNTGRHPDSGEEIKCDYDENSPTCLQIFKTVSEQHVGELSFFKVITGKAKAGLELQNTNRGISERLGTLYTMLGNNRNEVAHISAGDIGAVVKLKETHTGDTLTDKSKLVVFNEIAFPSPVIRVAIKPISKGDEEKLSAGLNNLNQEDPSFTVAFDPELQQTILAGQGEIHLDIIVKRLKQKMGVEVDLEDPRIPYRETVKGGAKAQGKYKKQSGGRGQYGDTWVEISPMARGEGFEFVNNIFGGVIPTKYIPAVEKGIIETMKEGVIAGYPVVDIKAILYDGSYHTVDSSDMAFKIAGSMAFKKAFMEAKPILLEPIYELEVKVPEEFMGDVMGDLSSRRGKILGMDSEGHIQLLRGRAPLAELYKYSTTLRSLTGGRGMHRRKFVGYEEVPRDLAEKIIEEAKKEKEKD